MIRQCKFISVKTAELHFNLGLGSSLVCESGDDVFFIHTGHQGAPSSRKYTDPVTEAAELMMLQGYG